MKTGRLLWWETIIGAVGGIILSGVTVTRSGPPAEVQELAPGLTVGSKIRGPDGKVWTIQSNETNPPGWYPCPNNMPATHPTGADLNATLRCRDGYPFTPADRAAENIDTPCTAGAVWYLCNEQGDLMLRLGPSQQEIKAATSPDPSIIMPQPGMKTTKPQKTWPSPVPPWGQPTSRWHLAISAAWAAYGVAGGVADIGGVTYYYEVLSAGYNSSGQYTVTYGYVGTNGVSGVATAVSS